MNDTLAYVDPFFGNGTIDLPRPEGIAATWFYLKAQTGNTHPGACAPFGAVSVCAHSGAYPTGYGLNGPNTHGSPARRFEAPVASGFAHFHHSGTGAIGAYYNYFRVTPLAGDLEQLGTRWTLVDEIARPGYYAAKLAETGITAELTASRTAAHHRYTFPNPACARLALDVSAGGIDFAKMRTLPAAAQITLPEDGSACGWVVLEALVIYFYAQLDAPCGTALWDGGEVLPNQRALVRRHIHPDEFQPFGVLFDCSGRGRVELRIGFSLRSVEQARQNLEPVRAQPFDQHVQQLAGEWRDLCDRIQVRGGTQAQRTTFYSSLYHSLIKPADLSGESPIWEEAPYYVDLATLWDQYKTQLPLISTFYPERASGILNTLISLAEHNGSFPNGFLLTGTPSQIEGQARSLAHYAIVDGFYRRIPGISWRRALRAMIGDLQHPRNRGFVRDGEIRPVTHILDLAGAAFCTAQLARGLGERIRHGEMMELSTRWRSAYDPATGRLIEAQYYEGGLWNYSFRLLHDMASRIALYPDERAFTQDLDRFFGYGQPPVVQPTDPADRDYMQWGFSLNRFEGLNNEPDIEVPYAYLYAGRPDRTAEVVRAALKYQFSTGRGGLPGNNDSGGLTSWYVWSALGLFPVTGQPVLLIGSPLFEGADLQVGERSFEIRTSHSGEANIYVQSATLNGEPLDRAYISVGELLQGGTLSLKMGRAPSSWATLSRPPSYAP
ncbi:MAG: glycoside hydrolase family 92 protein [Anaerolineae bacterium]|nr:glycoside hydrolase family 92 protein [Anaerolineae bacterium]